MNAHSPSLIRWRLAQVASHILIALIALVVIGGATRVMEAGLACPDWPLCYGSILPGTKMNLQVFLEWFHRLDAFLVGIALIFQFFGALVWRRYLPRSLVWVCGGMVLLVAAQGALGAFTVLHLLPSLVVVAHLGLALTLVAVMSGLVQVLLSLDPVTSPLWWRFMGIGSLLSVIVQALVGSRMATEWAGQRCLDQAKACFLLDLHRSTAIPVSLIILIFIGSALFAGGWPRSQWPYLLAVFILLVMQVTLGVFSVQLSLKVPFLTIAHQLVAVLLVSFLSAVSFRSPGITFNEKLNSIRESAMEPCHG